MRLTGGPAIWAWPLLTPLKKSAFYRAVLPTAGRRDPLLLDLLDFHRTILAKHYPCERISLSLSDGSKIDALFFPGKWKERALLVCNRATSFAEISLLQRESEVATQIEFLLGTGASVLSFNPPDVGHSEGIASEKTLTESVVRAYEYLIEAKKIDPSHVVIYGSCLGGCYGAIGAAAIQKKYPDRPISIVINRSFSSLPNLAHHLLKNPLIAFLAEKLMPYVGLGMDGLKALDTLKGEKLLIYHRFDAEVPFLASLYRATLEKPVGPTFAFELAESHWEPKTSYHKRPFTFEEGEALLEFFKKILDIPYNSSLIGAQFEVVNK